VKIGMNDPVALTSREKTLLSNKQPSVTTALPVDLCQLREISRNEIRMKQSAAGNEKSVRDEIAKNDSSSIDGNTIRKIIDSVASAQATRNRLRRLVQFSILDKSFSRVFIENSPVQEAPRT